MHPFVCVCVYCHFISSQYWTWLIVVQQMMLLQCRSFSFFSFSIKLSKDWLNLIVMTIIVFFSSFFFFSYRLCHYNKRLNNRRTTRIVIGKWLYTIISASVYAVTWFLSFLFFVFFCIRWIKLECTLCSKVNFVVLRSIICAIYICVCIYT